MALLAAIALAEDAVQASAAADLAAALVNNIIICTSALFCYFLQLPNHHALGYPHAGRMRELRLLRVRCRQHYPTRWEDATTTRWLT